VVNGGGFGGGGHIVIEDVHKGVDRIIALHGTTLGKWVNIMLDGTGGIGPNGHARRGGIENMTAYSVRGHLAPQLVEDTMETMA